MKRKIGDVISDGSLCFVQRNYEVSPRQTRTNAIKAFYQSVQSFHRGITKAILDNKNKWMCGVELRVKFKLAE
jgi:hypothetical protein